MSNDRIHRAVSPDGTPIAGRVVGQGPPLVLVHGILEDGDLCWGALGPLLRDRFTCFLMSTRGRGLSGRHPDVSPERLVEDVTAFVNSIGEPVLLVGESSGSVLALGAAARSNAVRAVAVHEPAVLDALDADTASRFDPLVARIQEAVSRGDLTDAARTFLGFVINAEERAAVAATDYAERCGPYMPLVLEELAQDTHEGGFSPTAPWVLARIGVPVLVLRGARTALDRWYRAAERHVLEHVPQAEARELPGTGHLAPFLAPQALADHLVPFFESAARAA
jgi:pimeloyl-ACP methyl ester carboxylesterase